MPTLHHSLLYAQSVDFSPGYETIFRPVSLTLHAGEQYVLTGHNGSGKTTLLRILAGLTAPGNGVIHWYCNEQTHTAPPVGFVSFLSHQLGLKLDLDAVENLYFLQALRQVQPQHELMFCLQQVGLVGYQHLPLRQLSAGQRKRVMLASLLWAPTPIWLLDEPFANLDAQGKALLINMMQQHCEQGGGVVFSTHEQGEIQDQSSHVLIMESANNDA